jgi:hypothetical protein
VALLALTGVIIVARAAPLFVELHHYSPEREKIASDRLGQPVSVKRLVSLLSPTGATFGGAAVGTAWLGPGVGTALGAKAGNFVDGLIDKKDERNPKH